MTPLSPQFTPREANLRHHLVSVCPHSFDGQIAKIWQFRESATVVLQRYPELGPGILGRVVAKVQRQHLAPRTGHNVGNKYGH
jgi:hypothetical protein